MGNAPSCKTYLARPSEDLRFSTDTEAKLLTDWLESAIKKCVGIIKWKSYSWSDLAELISANQDSYISYLHTEIFEKLEDIEIYDIRLIPLVGATYPPGIGPRTGAWAWLPDMSSRMWRYLDHNGNEFGGTTSINVADGARMAPRPPLPSQKELGIEAAYDDLVREASGSEDNYLIKVKHQFCITQYSPPTGAFKWDCEMVLLKISIRIKRCMILQITSSNPGVDSFSQITATNINGDELACISFNLEGNIGELMDILASRCNFNESSSLKLVFSSGKIGDYRNRCDRVADMLYEQEGSSSQPNATTDDQPKSKESEDFFPKVTNATLETNGDNAANCLVS